jgi:hypothetical protein
MENKQDLKNLNEFYVQVGISNKDEKDKENLKQ